MNVTAPTPPLTFPATVLIDQRESHPYSFTGFGFIIRTRTARLLTGDYSLDGYTGRIAIERKSLLDLYKTVANARRRFVEELKRLNDLESPAVVVEATWESVRRPPSSIRTATRIPPGAVVQACQHWQDMLPRVLWVFVDGRRLAEKNALALFHTFSLQLPDDGVITSLLFGV